MGDERMHNHENKDMEKAVNSVDSGRSGVKRFVRFF
jgi:hypothetical protein